MSGKPERASVAKTAESVPLNLIAVLVAVTDEHPLVLTIGDGLSLPSGPLELTHRSLQSGLRDWVQQQTQQPIGYVEQLYTFADRDRGDDGLQRMVSISYLGLTREQKAARDDDSIWRDWYEFFPWEDRRGKSVNDTGLDKALRRWSDGAPDKPSARARWQRCAIAFGFEPNEWNEDLVLQRYELLFEAGLIPEANPKPKVDLALGRRMTGDHRRILATGIARLRAKIKYRPVVFELMPPTFTLFQLQLSVEALAGRRLHKQNFRRFIEQQQLVEETGIMATGTGGRPAKLVRFRGDVVAERAISGSKLPLAGA